MAELTQNFVHYVRYKDIVLQRAKNIEKRIKKN